MSAKIIINKKSGIFSRAAYFTVYFDGKEVAEMVNSKTFVLEDEGVYAVQVRSKWMKSQTLIVKVNEGQEAFLLIRYGLKYFSFLYAIFLFSLAGNIFFITGKIVRPEWYFQVQAGFAMLVTLYTLFYFIFKRGEIWILEDANKKSR